MKLLCKVLVLGLLAVAFFLVPNQGYSAQFDKDKFNFFEWENPLARFSEMGFDLNEVAHIVGEGNMIISEKGGNLEVWTSDHKGNGAIETYKNTHIVTSVGIINKPEATVKRFFMDFESYPKTMSQFTEGDILKSLDSQYLVRLKQVYKFMIFSLSADFRYLYKQEKNGDLSVLLIDGDVGAGVCRIEFIPLDKGRTLVVSTNWIDVDSARFLYRTLMKAQPDLKPTAPIGASAMLARQIKYALDGEPVLPDCKSNKVPDYPEIPFYSTGKVPIKTLDKLSKMGTLVFIHPMQWIRTDKGVKTVEFVSCAGQLPGRLAEINTFSKDFNRIPEYFKQAKKVKYFEENGKELIDWRFKFGFGVVGVGVDYLVQGHWKNENTVYFEGIEGDIDPLHGALEWIDLGTGKTLMVFTAAVQIGDDASLLLKMGKSVPKVNVIASLFMGTLIVEKQAVWLEEQLKCDNHLVSR